MARCSACMAHVVSSDDTPRMKPRSACHACVDLEMWTGMGAARAAYCRARSSVTSVRVIPGDRHVCLLSLLSLLGLLGRRVYGISCVVRRV